MTSWAAPPPLHARIHVHPCASLPPQRALARPHLRQPDRRAQQVLQEGAAQHVVAGHGAPAPHLPRLPRVGHAVAAQGWVQGGVGRPRSGTSSWHPRQLQAAVWKAAQRSGRQGAQAQAARGAPWPHAVRVLQAPRPPAARLPGVEPQRQLRRKKHARHQINDAGPRPLQVRHLAGGEKRGGG